MLTRLLGLFFLFILLFPLNSSSSVVDGLANATTNPFCQEGFSGTQPVKQSGTDIKEISCKCVPAPVAGACQCTGNQLVNINNPVCQDMIQQYGTQLKDCY